MLGDMLEAVRWPQDPSPAPSGAFNRDGGAKGGKPESPSATRIRVPVGQIGTSTLAAHPTRQLFLAGTSPPPTWPPSPPLLLCAWLPCCQCKRCPGTGSDAAVEDYNVVIES